MNLTRFAFVATSLFVAGEVNNQPIIEQEQAQQNKQLTILFAGDVMQHGPQIMAAWNDSTNTYNYTPCFSFVAPIVEKYDIAIANLEVTLAGEPYTGYPQFSAPDELASALKNAGFDILATANNHSCDRGDNGIIRTVNVLDSIGILRTGTFKDSVDYTDKHPLLFEKNGIKVALLNYTYGTNGLTFKYPAMVNLIDEEKIRQDLVYTKGLHPDFIIVYFHWGNEYELEPNDQQRNLADLSRKYGADAVIGSHPHVIQHFEYHQAADSTQRNNLVVYSLGNFVSNQRDRNRDGGAMVGFTLLKTWNRTTILDPQYHLTWVYTPIVNEKKQYYILPVNQPSEELMENDVLKMTTFINDSRNRLNGYPLAIPEATYFISSSSEPQP